MASPSDANGIPSGQQQPASSWGQFNNIAFLVQQALAKMQTATLVRVDAVANAGEVSPVGLVDVTPLVNQLDAAGNPTPHATVYNVPYLRVQGGGNAIILDPQVGDIGVCVFASRDISKIKSTKAQGNPGSFRKYDFADGMYLGGMLNGEPTQFVQFSAAGIKISSPVAIILDAPAVTLEAETVAINASASTTITTPTFTVNGASTFNGATTVAGAFAQSGGGSTMAGTLAVTGGDITAEGISLTTHVHGGVQGGGSNTGGPQ